MAEIIKKLNIVMAGGGSGGHVFPIQSLLEFISTTKEYYNKIENIYRFGDKKSLEYKSYLSCQKLKNIKLYFVSIFAGKFRRETKFISWLKNIRDIFLFVIGFFQSFFFLIFYKVDTVFCKGGYVALPVVLSAFILRKKIVVHESDVVSGLTNRIAGRLANKVFTGFPGVFKNGEYIGQILSDKLFSFIDLVNPDQSHSLLEDKINSQIKKIDKQKTIILVLGGSLGSTRLYNEIKNFIQVNTKLASFFEFIIIGGYLNQNIDKNFSEFYNVYTFPFVSQKEIGQIYNISDIGITRAGTTSLAEQKIFNMKLFIVPISRTHDQYQNAKYYTDKYGDILLEQNQNFQKNIKNILSKYKKYKKNNNIDYNISNIQNPKHTIIKEIL